MGDVRPDKEAVGRRIEAVAGRRVYTYIDDDGNTYWSFYKSEVMVRPPARLILQSRIGQHFVNFLVSLRRKAEALDRALGTDG